ncbi:MAG: hypothetical protein ACRBDL_09925 [Alphaproteobacteria bacterium]
MVDSIGSYTQIQNISSDVSKSQKSEKAEEGVSTVVDNVTISEEAVLLAELDTIARNAGAEVAQNNAPLSGDQQAFESLI